MIEKKLVKKIVDNILHKEDRGFDRSIMHPKREWFIGLFVGLIMLIIGGWWNVSTYMQYREVSVGSDEVMAGVVVYRESLVKAALSDFSERTEKYESLKRELSEVSEVEVIEEEFAGEGEGGTTDTEISTSTDEVAGEVMGDEEDVTDGEILDEEVSEEVVVEEDGASRSPNSGGEVPTPSF